MRKEINTVFGGEGYTSPETTVFSVCPPEGLCSASPLTEELLNDWDD